MLVSFGARDVETDDGREQVLKAFVKCAEMAGRGGGVDNEGGVYSALSAKDPAGQQAGSLTAGGLPVSFQTLGDQY